MGSLTREQQRRIDLLLPAEMLEFADQLEEATAGRGVMVRLAAALTCRNIRARARAALAESPNDAG